MQRKGNGRTGEAVAAADVATTIEKTRTLSTEEEKVLRMRYGTKVSTKAPLERHGEGNEELQDELLLLEMQLLRAYRQHMKSQQAAPAKAKPAAKPTTQNRTKEKIVRALRKKH